MLRPGWDNVNPGRTDWPNGTDVVTADGSIRELGCDKVGQFLGASGDINCQY
jgi:hypothetical protein